MNLPDAVKSGFQKYVTFTGRASRSAYWYWALFSLVVRLGARIVDMGMGAGIGTLVTPLQGLAAVLLIVPSIAVAVRRLHDLNKSGWWFWIALIPIVGIIILIVWFCTKGTTGDNQFGPDPLQNGQ